MMQVGIFETIHFEGAYPVIRLFDNGVNEITIFTYENAYRQFQYLFREDMTRYNWVVKKESESKIGFIKRIYRAARKSDLKILYLNTISDNHLVYAIMISLLRNTRIIVTLHDINSHFAFRPGGSVRGWVRNIGKRALVKVTTEFNVVATTMVDYLSSKLPSYKKVHSIPGSVFEEEKRFRLTGHSLDPIRIVIPGSVDRRRRDYDLAFRLLEDMNEKKLHVVIIFLGGISEYGARILEKCKEYVSDTAHLVYFQTDIVDQPIFDREMDDAHLIFIPSVIDTVVSDGVQERYGLSISSGTIFDVIKHARPVIIPRKLAVPDDLDSSCFKYDSPSEIMPFVEKLVLNTATYTAWLNQAIENSQQYTVQSIRKKNPDLFT